MSISVSGFYCPTAFVGDALDGMTCITSHSFSGDNPRLFVVKEPATIQKLYSKSSVTVFRHALSMPSMNEYMS